ncbi:MAG TPA: aminotransferase class I/II-fold pyridoxal phosphate-dependent enzyme, partial [bacterium]|nr:aminotransferase class I/II-fold pyridoxal phosphate-dependent enzyme [bacterium]
RDTLLGILQDAGFACLAPSGAYYIICDITPLGYDDDYEFTMHLIREVGVAPVPGSSFFHDPSSGRHYVRFAFPKREETFDEVRRRLRRLRPRSRVTSVAPAGTPRTSVPRPAASGPAGDRRGRPKR